MLDYFGIYLIQLNKYIAPLIADGWLLEVNLREGKHHNVWQRCLPDASDTASIDEQVLEFCKTPKCPHEIVDHFGISRKKVE
ncbi:MAG: hypothetical protein LBE09_09335 [Christensenellaceae bacterium]|nr:hypothetical protein [Christensenellaceae bacterium]